jgi:hypothetical protein
MDSNNEQSGDGSQRGQSPRLLPVSAAAAAYRLVYERMDTLLRGRADVAPLSVPACPAWTIRQVVAHLTGVAQDIVSFNLEDKAADSWTHAQVPAQAISRSRSHSVLSQRWATNSSGKRSCQRSN